LKEYNPIDPVNVGSNQTLLTLLKFLWESINLGFWHDKQSAKEILNDILHVLSKSEAIANY
jgi:hypothetical protein